MRFVRTNARQVAVQRNRFFAAGGSRLRAASIIALNLVALLVVLGSVARAADDTAVLHTFTGGKDGSYPYGRLSADAAGNLYGTTQIGGTYGAGVVFKLSPTPDDGWTFSVLYEFTGGADGGYPLGGLVFDSAGNAYSTLSGGTANGLGGVFELSPPAHANRPWTETVLYSFRGGMDGQIPFGDLVFDAAGNLYGTTSLGGTPHIGCEPAKGCGTIYELTPSDGSWTETVLHRFTDAFGEGAEPRSGLVFDAAGNLYGTTYEGGNNELCNGYGCGTVFELMPPSSGKHWTFKNLIDFDETDGALPIAGVILDGAGNLYGATTYGGLYNDGTVFSMTNVGGHWERGNMFSFGANGIRSWEPAGTLALDVAGNLYGTTYEGGTNDWGAIFQLIPNGDGWTENVLLNFPVSGKGPGANPLDGVILDGAGNLYLTTNQGGSLKYCQPNSGCGTVLEIKGVAAVTQP